MFLLTLFILLCIDVLWLGVFNHEFYKPIVTKRPIDMLSGLLAWMLLAYAIEQAESPADAAKDGLVIYGVYNLTNFAIMKDYPLKIVLGDTAWGIAVTYMVKSLTSSSSRAAGQAL